MKEVEMDNHWDNEGGAQARYAEAEGDPVEDLNDPFSPDNVHIVHAITMLRIYDVLMAQFTADHPMAAKHLAELHAKGGLLTPPPAFDPNEVADVSQSPSK